MVKQTNKFYLTDEAQRPFDRVKAALISPPIFTMPTVIGEFILDTDESDCAIGAVISQK